MLSIMFSAEPGSIPRAAREGRTRAGMRCTNAADGLQRMTSGALFVNAFATQANSLPGCFLAQLGSCKEFKKFSAIKTTLAGCSRGHQTRSGLRYSPAASSAPHIDERLCWGPHSSSCRAEVFLIQYLQGLSVQLLSPPNSFILMRGGQRELFSPFFPRGN